MKPKTINVRGSLRKMRVGDQPLELPKSDHPVHSVRSAASAFNVVGKKFEVTDTGSTIIIKRIL